MEKNYIVAKKNKNGEIAFIDYSKIEGYKITPKNKVASPGIKVNSMVLIKPVFVEKILKRKIQNKLNYYLKYIEQESDDDESWREALDSASRFKDILEYKYRKYLDDKYINLLQKRITLIERELKKKMLYNKLKEETKEKSGKSR